MSLFTRQGRTLLLTAVVVVIAAQSVWAQGAELTTPNSGDDFDIL